MTVVDIPSNRITSRTKGVLFASVSLIVIFLFFYLSSLSNISASDGEYILISQTEALPLDVEQQELDSFEEDWIDVELPFHWRNQFPGSLAVWYRAKITRSQLEDSGRENAEERFGIYIWRINQTANVWLNGTLIGSGGRTEEPMARHWNSPLYFSIPESLLQDENEIHIKHYAQHSWGSMEAIIVGAEATLTPIYEGRYFIQHDVALGIFVFVVITGIFCFGIWFYRRQESQYLWFAIASIGLSFFCLNQFIRYLPFDADLWRWFSNISTDLWASSMLIFLLRSLNMKVPAVEKLVFAYVLSGIPIYFYASFYHVFDINIFYHLGSLLIGAYAFLVCVKRYFETRESLPAFYCGVLTIVVVAGVHDIFMQAIVNNGWLQTPEPGFQYHFNFLHFAAPLIFSLIGASLVKRFIDSMNKADSLNRELEQRVSEARDELAENYRAIEEVLINQSASEERERIYRDLHDDVGSKLLSLYYRLDNTSDSTLAKSALEDLRDIVSHKAIDGCSLSTAAQRWRSEAFNRTHDAGVSLSWHFDEAGTNFMLDESQHAQLRRMLREVLSNAILHSKNISEIKVTIDVVGDFLRVTVTNNGATDPVISWKPGRGISNLRVRSRDLQGNFSLNDLEEGWVQASWSIPLKTNLREAR
ncbi:MAG: hypothetical protein DHS20C12_09550 [Pseudohongiella sp.]|nr:MAG: hypothetical protein DHS20C12_09550 [Pseudohongiella sp.]